MAATPTHPAGKSLRVLIVGTDPSLEGEFRSAVAGTKDSYDTVHFADTHRGAVEVARRRQPDLVVIEIDREISEVAGLSRDLQAQVPAAAIAGAFSPGRLETGQSEGAAIIGLLRAEMRDFLRRPLSATEVRDVLARLFSRPQGAAPAVQGRVACFLSNKGGVGKSALAVNVACGLAQRHPDEVLLIDTSLQVGACAFLLDLQPTTSIVDAVRERDRLDRTLLRQLTLRHSCGLRLLAAPVDTLEAAEVDDEAIARIVNMARRSFEHVIIDTFPTLDSVQMTILDATDVAFVVVQGTAPAVAGMARLLPVLEGLGLPASRQRLVLNYNYKTFLGDLRPADIGTQLQRVPDYVVPYEKRVLVSMNTGRPEILRASRWQRFGRAITRIVDDIDSAALTVAKDPGPTPGASAPRTKDAGADPRLTDRDRASGIGRRA